MLGNPTAEGTLTNRLLEERTEKDVERKKVRSETQEPAAPISKKQVQRSENDYRKGA